MFNIAGIERNSIVDGEGWRYVIFFQGCMHACEGCHNPETWKFGEGQNMTVDEVLDDLEKCNSTKIMDITLSGGDPFFQAKDILPLAKALKEKGYNIWAYTGFKFDNFLQFKETGESRTANNVAVTSDMVKLLKYIDVVVDGPFLKDERTVERLFVGSKNQRLVDVKKSLRRKKVVEYNVSS